MRLKKIFFIHLLLFFLSCNSIEVSSTKRIQNLTYQEQLNTAYRDYEFILENAPFIKKIATQKERDLFQERINKARNFFSFDWNYKGRIKIIKNVDEIREMFLKILENSFIEYKNTSLIEGQETQKELLEVDSSVFQDVREGNKRLKKKWEAMNCEFQKLKKEFKDQSISLNTKFSKYFDLRVKFSDFTKTSVNEKFYTLSRSGLGLFSNEKEYGYSMIAMLCSCYFKDYFNLLVAMKLLEKRQEGLSR